jgi:D-methionine transport system ATP-binding protein
LIRDLQQRLKITVVLITHQMEVIREICNEVAVMDSGTIVEQGSVTSIFTTPQAAATREMLHV